MALLVAGNNPAAIKTAERNNFTATAGQTTFAISQGYQPGDIDVYLNGVRLIDSDDYYATDGITVVLNSAATLGDSIVIVCFRPFQVADFYTKSEQDTRYVNATGDTITGPLVINSTGNDRLQITSGTQSVYFGLDSNGAAIAGGAGQTGPGVYLYNTEGSVNLFTNNLLRVKVDSSGRMTNPYQPLWVARQTQTNNSSTASPGSKMSSWDTLYNIGNNWNTTNHRFTSPINGMYQVTMQGIKYPMAGALHVDIWKNGSMQSQYRARAEEASGYNQYSVTCFIQLNINDYIEFYYFGDAGLHADHGTFSIRLAQ